jgi:2OG-Fe(II) oxygenase superfamily
MLNIIDNFIKSHIQDSLEELFLGKNFNYFYNRETIELDGTNNYLIDKNTLDAPQFNHVFVDEYQVYSTQYNNVLPISNKLIDIIDVDCAIVRCKLNMNVIDLRFEEKYHTPHIDNGHEDQITAIYYVNDSDGDTFFFDNKGQVTERITPKKGRLVWWKGRIFHAKSSPTKSISRVVLNFNLLPLRKDNDPFRTIR